jgi:glycosyltransferase involved in cell wall biosynthesis
MSETKPVGKPTVSIVIPAHNGGHWIREAIDSVFASTFTDFELVVRDDGSTDGTREYLSALSDPRVRVVFAKTNKGAWENWSEVSALARGEFTKVLCQDDLVFPECLQRQVDALRSDHTISMVASRHTVIDARGEVVLPRHGLSGLVGKRLGSAAIDSSVVSGANQFGEPASVMFRTDALIPSLPFNPDYPYLTDLDMYRKVLTHGDFLGLGTVDAAFRVSTGSWSKRLEETQSSEFIGWIDTYFGTTEAGQSPGWLLRAKMMVRLRTVLRRFVVTLINWRSRPSTSRVVD